MIIRFLFKNKLATCNVMCLTSVSNSIKPAPYYTNIHNNPNKLELLSFLIALILFNKQFIPFL